MSLTARSVVICFACIPFLVVDSLAGDGGKPGGAKAGGPKGGAPAIKANAPAEAAPEFVTFTQDEWGEGPGASPKVTKLLEERFAEVFPDGLPVGSGNKKGKLFVFKSGEQIRKVLPLRGSAAPLSAESREGVEDAGALAGEMIAARLNQRFNRHGMLGDSPLAKKKDLELRDMQFEDGVAKPLIGKTVQQVFQWADAALGGEYGTPDPKKDSVDVDGDGKPDVSFGDLRRALMIVNENFPHGERTEGRLALPGKVHAPAEVDDPDIKKKIWDLLGRRDEKLKTLEDEHDIQIDKARAAARTDGKPEIFDAKRLELEGGLSTKKADILKSFETERLALRKEWEAKHPNSPGNGPPVEPGLKGKGKNKDGG